MLGVDFETMITSAAEFHQAVQALQKGTSSPLSVALCDIVDETLVETLCAFANMPSGGSILLNLPDRNAKQFNAGLETETLQAQIQTLAQHRVSPGIPVQFFRASFEDHSMLVVNVPAPDTTVWPYRVTATHQAYVRNEYGNYPLGVSEIQQLHDARQATSHDGQVISGSGLEYLDETLVQDFVEAVRQESTFLHQASDEDILQAKGVMSHDGLLTLAGLYALGRYPQQFFPNLRITAGVRASGNTANVEQQRFEGPVPVMVDDAVRWVMRQAGQSGPRPEHQAHPRSSNIPIAVIRELLTNALVHRDLSSQTLGQSVQLELHEDELTVRNPGGLHRINLNQLGREPGETAVNTSLYEICRFVSVSGGHRIVDPAHHTLRDVHWALRRAGLYAPTYTDSGLYFTVAVGRRYELTETDQQWLASLPSHEHFTTQQRYLLVSMSDGTRWSPETLRREYGPIGAKSALRQLDRLADLGLVRAQASLNSTNYRLHDTRLRTDAQRFGGTIEFQPAPDAAPAAQPVHPIASGTPEPHSNDEHDAAARAAAASKHGATLWNVLGEETMNIHDIAQAANLSLSQTRYGIQRLVSEGIVDRQGGQGHRETVYRRAQG